MVSLNTQEKQVPLENLNEKEYVVSSKDDSSSWALSLPTAFYLVAASYVVEAAASYFLNDYLKIKIAERKIKVLNSKCIGMVNSIQA